MSPTYSNRSLGAGVGVGVHGLSGSSVGVIVGVGVMVGVGVFVGVGVGVAVGVGVGVTVGVGVAVHGFAGASVGVGVCVGLSDIDLISTSIRLSINLNGGFSQLPLQAHMYNWLFPSLIAVNTEPLGALSGDTKYGSLAASTKLPYPGGSLRSEGALMRAVSPIYSRRALGVGVGVTVYVGVGVGVFVGVGVAVHGFVGSCVGVGVGVGVTVYVGVGVGVFVGVGVAVHGFAGSSVGVGEVRGLISKLICLFIILPGLARQEVLQAAIPR